MIVTVAKVRCLDLRLFRYYAYTTPSPSEKSLEKRYTYMITSVMVARQTTEPLTPNPAKSFPPTLLRTLKLSCRSFLRSCPLFSIVCGLFSQNTRGWGTPHSHLFLADIPTCRHSEPAHTVMPALCFHNVTNCFSRKSLVLTIIRIARGVGLRNQPDYALAYALPCRSLFGFDPFSP